MKTLFVALFALGIAGPGISLSAANPPPKKEPVPSAAQDATERGARVSRQTGAESASFDPGKPSPIDINSADFATLEKHPLIGPQAAKAIVAARPFASLDDLSRLQGLSPERIEQIRGVVTNPALMAESPAPDRIGPEHGKVDVNTASRATLEAIPAIGADLAPTIIAARPFARIDDLDRIQGISAERLELVRNALTVGTPEGASAKKPAKRGPKSKPLEPTGRPTPAPGR